MGVPKKQIALQLAEAVTPPSEVLINADITSKLNPSSEISYYTEWSKPDFIQTIQDNPNLLMNMRVEALQFYLAHQTDFPELKKIIDDNRRYLSPLLENLAKDTKYDLLLLAHPHLAGELCCPTFTQFFKKYFNNYTLLPILRADQDNRNHEVVLHSLTHHLNYSENHTCKLLTDLSDIAEEALTQLGKEIAETPARYVSLYKLVSPNRIHLLLNKLAEEGKHNLEKYTRYQQLVTLLLSDPYLAIRQLLYNVGNQIRLQLYNLSSRDENRVKPKLPISEALLEKHLQSLAYSDIEIITEKKPENYLELLNLLLSLSNQALLQKHQEWLLPRITSVFAHDIISAQMRYKVISTAVGGALYGQAVQAISARQSFSSSDPYPTFMVRQLNPTWLRQQNLHPKLLCLIEQATVISEWLNLAINGNKEMAKLFCAYSQLLVIEFSRALNDRSYNGTSKQLCSKIKGLFKILDDLRIQELKDHPQEKERITQEYQLRNFSRLVNDYNTRRFLENFPELITRVSISEIVKLLLIEISLYPVYPVASTSLNSTILYSTIRDLLSIYPDIREHILHTQDNFELVEKWPELFKDISFGVFQDFLQRCARSLNRDEFSLVELWHKPGFVKIFMHNPRFLSALSLENVVYSCLENSGTLAGIAKIAPFELRSSMILHPQGEALLDQDMTLLSGMPEAACNPENSESQAEVARPAQLALQPRLKLHPESEVLLDQNITLLSGISEAACKPEDRVPQTTEVAKPKQLELQSRLKLHPDSEALLDQDMILCTNISEDALNKVISSGKYTTEKNIPHFKTILERSPIILCHFQINDLIKCCTQYSWLVTLISKPSLSILRNEMALSSERADLFVTHPHCLIGVSKAALVNLVNIYGVKLIKAAITVQTPAEIPVEIFISLVELNHEFAYLCMRSKKIKEADKYHFITMLNSAADEEHLPSLYECGRYYREIKQYRSAADRLIAYSEIMGPHNSTENNVLTLLVDCVSYIVIEDINLGLSYYSTVLQLMSNTVMVNQFRPNVLSLASCVDTREDRIMLLQHKDLIEHELRRQLDNNRVITRIPFHATYIRDTYISVSSDNSINNLMNRIFDRYVHILLVNNAFIERQQFYYNTVASLYLILTRIDFATLKSDNQTQVNKTSIKHEYLILIVQMCHVLDQISSTTNNSLALKARSTLDDVMLLGKNLFDAHELMIALDDQQITDTTPEKKFKRQPLSQSELAEERLSEKLFCSKRANFLDAYASRDEESIADKRANITMAEQSNDEQAHRTPTCLDLRDTACTQMTNLLRSENSKRVHKITLPMITPPNIESSNAERLSLQSYLHVKIALYAPKMREHLEQAEKIRPEHELAIKDQSAPTEFSHHSQMNDHNAELKQLKCLTIVGLFKHPKTSNNANNVVKHAKAMHCNVSCRHFKQSDMRADLHKHSY